jgi:mRNA interferase RelE/StbE
MPYQIKISSKARNSLKKLSENLREKLILEINSLSNEPRPKGYKKLKGYENYYRIRMGNYRIIYEINDNELLILVLNLGKRDNIYDQF